MRSVHGGVLLALVAAAALLVVARSEWARLAWEPAAVAESDFQLHWVAGRALESGGDPYDARTVNTIGASTGRGNTPFCAANPLVVRLFALSGDDLHAAYGAWRDVNLVLLALSVLGLAGCLRRALHAVAGPASCEWTAAVAVALGLVALDDGSWMALYYNQANLVALLALVGALAAAQRGRHGLEGVLIAVAAAAKTSPALLLLVAALPGRRRTLLAGLAAGAALLGVSLLWNGVAVHESYLRMLGLRLGYAAEVPAGELNNSLHDWNLAPNGLLGRAAEVGSWPPGWARGGAWGLSAIVLAALAWRVRRRRAAAPAESSDSLELLGQYACGVAASFLVSSVTWSTHLVLVALPGIWLVAQAWTTAGRGAAAALPLVAGAAVLAVLFLPLGTWSEEQHLHLDVLLKTDALLALFALTLWRPASERAAERYQPPTAAPSTGRTKASEGITPSRR